MYKYYLKRLTVLVLALLLCVTVSAGCKEEDEDDTARVCSYCGAEYYASDEFRHGVYVCVSIAPCGIAGHYIRHMNNTDKNGNRHRECELCGELTCNGKRHGEGVCEQAKRGFGGIYENGNIEIRFYPSDNLTDDLFAGMESISGAYVSTCYDQYSADIVLPNGNGTGVVGTFLTHNGSEMASTGFAHVTLAPGKNTFAYMLTAENGENRLCSFVIDNIITQPSGQSAALSGDNSLSTFKLEFQNGRTLDLTDPDIRKNITVSDMTSARVTAKASHSKAVVSGDSGTIALAVGENRFCVVVTAEDGSKAYFYYTVNLTLTPSKPSEPSASGDATLAGLSLSAPDHTINLSPAFSSGTFVYNTEVSGLESLTVSATANHAGATVSGAGIKSLVAGPNTFTVTVTAEDGVTRQTYTITVSAVFPPSEPQASGDATLAGLSLSAPDHTINLSPAFSSGTFVYNTEVSGLDSLTVSATANHAGATVSGAGIKSLVSGPNTFTVTVTAEDGVTRQTYTVTVSAVFPSSEPPA